MHITDMTEFFIDSDFFKTKGTRDGNGNLISEKGFKIFPNKSDRIALIYGRNGSGKSSIARSFYSLEAKDKLHLKICSEGNDITESINNDSRDIYVFDEEYINKKIKISDDGLNSIVLIGDQVNLEKELRNNAFEIDKNNNNLIKLENELNELADKKNSQSPEFFKERYYSTLKNRWAILDSKIKGNKQNSSVTDQLIKKITSNKIIEGKLEDLIQDLNKEFEKFDSISNDSQEIDKQINVSGLKQEIDLIKTNNLLMYIPPKPELTEREQQIINYLDEDYNKVQASQVFLKNIQNTMCDKCLQIIDNNYRENMLDFINNILNKEIECFSNEVSDLIIKEVEIENIEKYLKVDDKLVSQVILSLKELNRAIVKHNDSINMKLKNIFMEIEYDGNLQIKDKMKNILSSITKIEQKIEKYNEIIQDREKKKQQLIKNNLEIAYLEISDDYGQCKTQLKLQENKEQELNKIKKMLEDLENERSSLANQMKNTDIALKEINDSLKYIFLDDSRLVLKPGKDSYYNLFVNGNPVKPDKVSTGERNAIALSYFFTEIAEGESYKDIYKKKCFVLIDDPISSFDFGNKIGMISFVKKKISNILLGNKKTKLMILTHDISVMLDFSKVLEEVSLKCKTKGKPATVTKREISEMKLVNFSKNRNDYTETMKRTFRFACKKEGFEEDEIIIGNVMRRLLEGFATFSYKKGMSEITIDETLLDIIPEDKREYFENLMYRLLLNQESHNEEKMQSETENLMNCYFTLEEKVITAKSIMCYIYLLNKYHVLYHLSKNGDFNSIILVIEKWIKSLN